MQTDNNAISHHILHGRFEVVNTKLTASHKELNIIDLLQLIPKAAFNCLDSHDACCKIVDEI